MIAPRISRRSLLQCGAAALATSALPRATGAAPKRELTVETRTLDVAGRAARVYGITGPDGRPGLTLDRSQGFDVLLTNKADVPTIVHWHGLTPPFAQDGNTLSQPPIAPGDSMDFAFDLPRAGTHWMHSHVGLQEAQLMAAPLIVRDGPPQMQEVVMILHDFSFAHPEEIFERLVVGEATHVGSGVAASKKGMMRMPMPGMDGGMMAQGDGDADGDMPMEMDLNDIAFDAYLANDRTLDDPEVVPVERGAPVRLRIVNAAAATNFWIDLGAVTGRLIAVDGMDVAPIVGRRFEIAIAQRLDIVLDVPNAATALPIIAQREGDVGRTGILLATPGGEISRLAQAGDIDTPPVLSHLERRLVAQNPLEPRDAGRAVTVSLTGSMSPYAWTIDGRAFASRAPTDVTMGERVELTMANRTMMSHPMHLHGHHFQVVGLGRARFAGAMRDTVLVPAMDSVTIAFDASNPGEWPLHCHNLYHMYAGMMTTVRYV